MQPAQERLKHGNKSDRIDARKLADLLRLNDLEPVYHGETGVRMLRELARSYLTIVKDLSRVMNRLKALCRSWAIPCAGRDVYYTRHRRRVAGENSRGRHWPPSPATLSATGHAAALAPCANKPGENCWRRVARIRSPPNCDRFPLWARFALLWRWL
jgi:transposase